MTVKWYSPQLEEGDLVFVVPREGLRSAFTQGVQVSTVIIPEMATTVRVRIPLTVPLADQWSVRVDDDVALWVMPPTTPHGRPMPNWEGCTIGVEVPSHEPLTFQEASSRQVR